MDVRLDQAGHDEAVPGIALVALGLQHWLDGRDAAFGNSDIGAAQLSLLRQHRVANDQVHTAIAVENPYARQAGGPARKRQAPCQGRTPPDCRPGSETIRLQIDRQPGHLFGEEK
ncbi:hypothetical protein, partial [Bradyrhizobium oligotrophicum]|uniref:hypothetical protein n=1 Tax=Bradyrhizobium oligotrophicum TaxID=44255 RepID=UPI003EB814E6